MSERSECHREGSLEAPTRHPIRWQEPGFYDEAAPNAELARVCDVCHGCRRCVSLCNTFPTLFDLVDNSPTSIRHTTQRSWSSVIYTISAI
jgi:glycerol-3-phosphate dehydrogenase subunit C